METLRPAQDSLGDMLLPCMGMCVDCEYGHVHGLCVHVCAFMCAHTCICVCVRVGVHVCA